MDNEIKCIKTYKFFELEFHTLEEAANYFNVAKQTMCNVFSGSVEPSAKMLAKVGYRKEVIKTIKYIKLEGKK